MTCSNDHKGIDLNHARSVMKEFLGRYQNENDPGFEMKTVHTYRTADLAREIAEREGFVQEDCDLAVLIALLHDVGRFEELKIRRTFNSAAFDHASHGVKMLREGLLREFVDTEEYDDVILDAISVHSLYSVPDIADEKTRRHALVLRDSDKLDNFRSRAHEPVNRMFGSLFHDDSEMADSKISEAVMESLRHKQCVRVTDRKTPLDYYVTVLGFWFDLTYESSKQIAAENGWIETMVSRFAYTDPLTKQQMNEILQLIKE